MRMRALGGGWELSRRACRGGVRFCSSSAASGTPEDRYTHGHSSGVINQHSARTAENSARHLLPSLRDGLDVIDVGCGPGSISVGLARAVAPRGTLVAVDVAEDVLPMARAAARDAGVTNATFEVASVYDLPHPDDRFDVAHAHQVLQHLSDPVAALRELRRVVKPGGLIAIRDADYASMLSHPVMGTSPSAPSLHLPLGLIFLILILFLFVSEN